MGLPYPYPAARKCRCSTLGAAMILVAATAGVEVAHQARLRPSPGDGPAQVDVQVFEGDARGVGEVYGLEDRRGRTAFAGVADAGEISVEVETGCAVHLLG